MLNFVEEIVLLQLDERHSKLIDLPLSAADVVVAGAALMELALAGRVDTDLQHLVVVDPTPTGNEILDDALAQLAGPDDLTAGAALERVGTHARRHRDEALRHLVKKGVLREEGGRFLWMFDRRRCPVIDDREQQEVKARLRQVLLTDEIPDPRDIVLICLIDACNLLDLVLTPAEAAGAAARVQQLGRMDLIGQAVTKAVSEIRFIVRHATTPVY